MDVGMDVRRSECRSAGIPGGRRRLARTLEEARRGLHLRVFVCRGVLNRVHHCQLAGKQGFGRQRKQRLRVDFLKYKMQAG